MVELYREARLSWERRRDAWAIGYPTEERDYARVTGDVAPNLKDWLASWSTAMSSSADEELAS
jgi:hypothetical protein